MLEVCGSLLLSDFAIAWNSNDSINQACLNKWIHVLVICSSERNHLCELYCPASLLLLGTSRESTEKSTFHYAERCSVWEPVQWEPSILFT